MERAAFISVGWNSGCGDGGSRSVHYGSRIKGLITPRACYIGWTIMANSRHNSNGERMTRTLLFAWCKPQQGNPRLRLLLLYEAAQPLMSKGQFGARDLQKHLWKLPIPEYDATNRLHQEIAMAGQAAASEAVQQLQNLYKQRGDAVSTTVVRRELRGWLAQSDEGKQVETLVKQLLA